jgi:hypothetical protein
LESITAKDDLRRRREKRLEILRESRGRVGVCENGLCVVGCNGVHKIVGARLEKGALILEVNCNNVLPIHEFKICWECSDKLLKLISDLKGGRNGK